MHSSVRMGLQTLSLLERCSFIHTLDIQYMDKTLCTPAAKSIKRVSIVIYV